MATPQYIASFIHRRLIKGYPVIVLLGTKGHSKGYMAGLDPTLLPNVCSLVSLFIITQKRS